MESRSNVNGPAGSTGPAPAAHNRASSSRVTASSSRTLDHLNARSHDPIVDGARSWSNSSPVAPACSSAVSATESPPSSIDPITVNAFVPLFAPCAGQTHALLDQTGEPDLLGQHRRGQQSRARHEIRLVATHRHAAEIVGSSHLPGAFRAGERLASRTTSSLLRGHLDFQARRITPTSAVNPGLDVVSEVGVCWSFVDRSRLVIIAGHGEAVVC